MSDNLPDVAETIKELKFIASGLFNSVGDTVFDAARLLESLSARVTQAETTAAEHANSTQLWAQRTSPSTVVVRRGLKTFLALIDDGEVGRLGRELLALDTPEGEPECEHDWPYAIASGDACLLGCGAVRG